MRAFFLVAAAGIGLVTVACGLDANGLAGDDAGEPTTDAGSPFDGTIGPGDTDGDGAANPDTAPTTGDDSGGGWEDSGDGSVAYEDAGPDAQCTGHWTCTAAAIPAGWQIVEYAETGRPSCSTGYGSPLDVVEGPTGQDAMCTCGCNLTTPGSCESGDFTVSWNAAGAATCVSGSATVAANGGACSTVTAFTVATGEKLQIAQAPFIQGACTPAATQTVPAVSYAAQGLLCADTIVSSAPCPDGGACAPVATANGFHLCIVASGVQACPPGSGFTKSHTIGTGVTDTRECSACTCGDNASCVNGQLSIFTGADCGSGGASMQANNTCTSVPVATDVDAGDGGGPTFVAYQYSAQVQGEACAATGGSPTGSVSLAATHTICCE